MHGTGQYKYGFENLHKLEQIQVFIIIFLQILLMMTVIYLILAVFSNWARHTNFFLNFRSKIRYNYNTVKH